MVSGGAWWIQSLQTGLQRTKFARQHKVPVRRSAFTCCENEVPTGLDLAKEKYGGSFTTEQVEDVKAFYGILKVLFSFGIVDYAANSLLPVYAQHVLPYSCLIVKLYTHQQPFRFS